MDTVRWVISTAPEIFLLLAVAIGTVFGRVRVRGFSIGTTACTLIVVGLIGQLGTFTFPPVLRVFLFSLFVFTIAYQSGPEFFASLSVRTLAQVALALVLGGTGLVLVLCFAFIFSLDPGTVLLASLITPSRAEDQAASRRIQEDIWALPLPLPMFAYLVRPAGDGPFPLESAPAWTLKQDVDE